ncbi:LamG-like jellyroll fold domain-containing protein [Nitrosopumilus adriaticus]|uniref:LamG-like jellyroll fold domain-containing protein n=1 Tax=Nitrosopumilus adriaticus TaxID=1580092 RepID=UPI0013641A11|nr:LamG-like jellyroll fold domain-containing protein [Nitrosopumilus adriaticus]
MSTLSSGTDYVFSYSVPENFDSVPENFDSVPENFDSVPENFDSVPENFDSVPKYFSINLTEKMGIAETKKQSDKSKIHSITLKESINVTNNPSKNEIILIKYDSDRKLMMERIFDRQSKFEKNNSKLLQTVSLSTLLYHEQNFIDNNLIFSIYDSSIDEIFLSVNNFIPNIFDSEKIISNLSNIDKIFNQNNIEILNDQIFDVENPILLILLIPFAGFVLIRYDNEQTKFYQIKQFFTLAFIVILLSSAVITPMSISSSYWGYAFGQIDNSTETILELETTETIPQNNMTNISEYPENLSEIDLSKIILSELNSMQFNNEISISDVLSVTLSRFSDNTTPDSHVSDSIMAISDVLSVTLSRFSDNTTPDSHVSDSIMAISDVLSVTLSRFSDNTTPDSHVSDSIMAISDVLSTTLTKSTGETIFSSTSDSIMAISDVLSVTLSRFSDNTTPDSHVSESTISFSDSLTTIFTPGFSLDDAKLSLEFDSLENGTASDNAKISKENSLLLDGDQDFIHLSENSTNNLQSFFISAWIKPDYSEGSPEFTVVSKENSFVLSVNNQISNNIAKFSIFDGIKWTQVESISEIPQEWTYLTAAFSNNSISIYVNGEFEAKNHVAGVPTISLDGKLESVDVESISSENDIVIGAYISTKNNLGTPNSMFSGMIDDVGLFDFVLSETQIIQLYSEGLPTHGPSQEKSIDEILREIELESGLYIQNSSNIQAQLSFSDALSFTISEAQISSQAQNSSNIQAQLSFSDALSFTISEAQISSQAQNSTSTSITVPEINPHITSLKDTYTVAENAEFTFEFYDESDAMIMEFENLDELIDSSESEIDSSLNESDSLLDDFFGLSELIPEADAAKDDGSSIKAKIKQLKKQISQIKQKDNISQDELNTIKNKIKLLVEQLKDEVKESNKEKKIKKLNKLITKIEKIITKNEKQKDNWINNKETIIAEIYDAHNNKVELDITFEKQREGKFNIKIDPQNAKPGIYKIKTILNIDGKQFISENEFAWGLVSVNTIKSIYKPNDLAEFIIVVLNSTGNPVCDSNISMIVTDPNLFSTHLSTENEIIQSPDCGLYDANYIPTSVGNYTLNISAETETGIAKFSTYFVVQENFDYDIIRHTESKIDPFNYRNAFDVEIEITSFVGDHPLTIREYVPAEFEVIETDGIIKLVGNKKEISWTISQEDNRVEIGYAYSVPLITPELYPLGKMEIDQQGIPTFTEARNWFVAVDPQIAIESAISLLRDHHNKSQQRSVAINSTHVYEFFIDDNADIAFKYSKNNGVTWQTKTVIQSGTFQGVAAWYEPWTPGLTSKIVHLASYGTVADKIWYFQFNPTNNTASGQIDTVSNENGCTSSCLGRLASSNDITITVATDETVYAGTIDNTSPKSTMSSIRECSGSCTNTSSWTSAGSHPWGSTEDGEYALILLPLTSGDIMLVNQADNTHELRYKILTGSSWSGSWTNIDTGVVDSTTYENTIAGAVRPDNTLFVSAVVSPASTSSSVRAYSYNSTWYTLQEPATNADNDLIMDTSLAIDNVTNNVYVGYIEGSGATNKNVYYKISTTNGDTWGTEEQASTATGNYQALSMTLSHNKRIFTTWFEESATTPKIWSALIFARAIIQEILSITDQLTTQKLFVRNLSETLSISDLIIPSLIQTASLSETLSISDIVDGQITSYTVVLSDTLSISDSLNTDSSFLQILSETLNSSDNIDAEKRTPGDDPDARPLTVRKLTGTVTTTTDVTISPPLVDFDKAIALCSFRHSVTNDHSESFKGWELESNSVLKIHATTHSGVSPADYVCYITEFGSASTVDSKTSIYINPNSETATTISNSIGQTVDLGETMEWFQGHTHDANESSVGDEELERVRLTSSTNWEWNVRTDPGSGDTTAYLGVFDWNNLDVFSQRGQTQISSGSTAKTLDAGIDFTGIDRTRSLLFVSFNKDEVNPNYLPHTTFIRATITESGNLVFTRNTSDSNAIDINWTLIQLPVGFATIRHGNHTQSAGVVSNTFALDNPVLNMTKAFAIGTVCAPFGCGTGTTSNSTAGAIDEIQATLEVIDPTTVRVIRGNGASDFEITYQVIDWLNKKGTISESLSFSDSLTTQVVLSRTMSDSLTISDTIATTTSIIATLDDSLAISDTIATTANLSVTLDDSLTISDTIATTASIIATLDDSLTISDTIATTASIIATLDDSLAISDTIATTASIIATLDDSLAISDTIATTASIIATLSDSLALTDTIATTSAISATLSDSLALTDVITTTSAISATLSDSLALTDTVSSNNVFSATLSDSLALTDVVSATTAISATLSDSLALTDTIATTSAISATLSDSLALTDTIATTSAISATLSDSLALTDTIFATKSVVTTLSDILSLTDIVATASTFTRNLSETLSTSDNFGTFKGSLKIRSVDGGTLIPGATFTISPSPTNGTDTYTITDGWVSPPDPVTDSNSTSGEIRILNVPFGDYEIVMTEIPAGYDVKVNQTTVSLCCDEANPLKIFSLRSNTVDLSQAGERIGVSPPSLNQTSLNKMTGFSASVVKGTTETSITKSNDLPPQVTAGVNNAAAKTNAVSLQKNIKYVNDWSVGTKGSIVQEGLKLPKYYLPSNKSLTTVIPAVVSQESTTHQMISTPPFNKVTPGQQMILPVESTLIPSFGGVSKLDITSKDTSSTTGDKDWIVIEVDNDHISSVTLADSSIDRDLELEISVDYRYEEDTVGFNWGTSSNFASDPIMTVLVPKPTSTDIITLANGCRDLQVHTLVGGVWTSGIDTILSNIPSTTKTDFCEVEIESDHYSNKAISSKRSSSPGAGTGGLGSSSTGGGGGNTGAGASASGASVGFGGILSTPLAINEVSYDKCNENMARILVSSDADVPPSVKLATSKSGVVYASLAEVQPYEDLNKLTSIDRYLYEVPISSDESFLMIVVTEEKGTSKNVVQASVRLLSCEGTTVIVELPEDTVPEITGQTRIFDTKIQIANGTKYDAKSESEFLYIDNQELKVSSIIESNIPLERVELRSLVMGQPDSQYIAINMNVEKLQMLNSTYLVSGTIPSFAMAEPGMTYWLHITDENDNISESAHYSIGVKPTTVGDISIEMDIPNIIPSGSLVKPELYIFNDDTPSYGIASLVVDGKVVAKKSQLFGIGQTQVIFNWKAPISDDDSILELQGRVDLYDHSTITISAQVSTHPRTVTISAYDTISLDVIEKDGQVLADPALIYASNADSDLRFRVTDPLGQCIIGGTEECLINESTKGKRGGLESIPYGDQILRVRYSGADNALERFSITSIDPITGKWSVSVETEDGLLQQAHATDDAFVKVKYRYHSETITVKSE